MRTFLPYFLACTLLWTLHAPAQSVYTAQFEDSRAITLAPGSGAVGDGVADDTAALQGAIDRVADTHHQGIVFVGAGRYRLSRTVFIWPGVRLIGYGTRRPVLFLGAHTPGYASTPGYMLFFAGAKPSASEQGRRRAPTTAFPGTVPATPIVDANPGTFYSAISNIDLEIGDGNPGAVGIRSHYAQHCFLAHMDFRLGSGLAGIDEAGNLADDLHFFGGEYGIRTGKPSPGWQFTLLDSSFDGQRVAAIREHEAGLTLVHSSIEHVPAAIVIDEGFAEQLWVSDSHFAHIQGPAITISLGNNPRTQINLRHIRCTDVPTFALFRESRRTLPGKGERYQVATLSHGLTLDHLAESGTVKESYETEPFQELANTPVLREPPENQAWANAHDLGVVGDGAHDDTLALQTAIRTHRVVYLPMGQYRITATLELRPDTVLFGLHPSATQIVLDEHSPLFQGVGAPVAMLHAPPDGTTALSGIGLYAGGTNDRASALMWQGGEHSQVNDVRFLGGHGTNDAQGKRLNPYNPTHTGDPDPQKRWESQYPSLWVLEGGGGVFADIWTPDTFAQAGMKVSDTSTPGSVYELSSEHHVNHEIELQRAAHWKFFALQTEEEWGEGGHALPVSVRDSRDILFANFHSYRVVGSRDTLPNLVEVSHSSNIEFRNAHMDSDSKVAADNGVADIDSGQAERAREFANLVLDTSVASQLQKQPAVKRLVGGFYNISGSVVDAKGRVLFVDTKLQKIYRWWPEQKRLELLRDAPLTATNLFLDNSGNVFVVCYGGDGTVLRFDPDSPTNTLEAVQPQPATARPNATAWLPDDFWTSRPFRADMTLAHKPFQYVSPDGSTYLPAGPDFVHGELYYGTKMADVLRTFALAPAMPSRRFYLTAEEESRTWAADVGPDGALTNLKLFAERGGESVVTDGNGDVYIADGEVFIYDANGKPQQVLSIPERPISLLFSPDGNTLYVLARTSIYAWKKHP